MGKEEGLKEEKRRGWMTRSGKGKRNARDGKERMVDPKRERRKECNWRKGKDKCPSNGRGGRKPSGGKERMDDLQRERRKE